MKLKTLLYAAVGLVTVKAAKLVGNKRVRHARRELRSRHEQKRGNHS